MLLEKLLISQEEIDKYEDLPDNEKLLFLYDLLKNHPNKNNLQLAKNVYAGSISEDGFDDRTNPFIKFINNTKHDFNEEQAELIRELIYNDSLSPNEYWLYKPSLWNEGDQETLFKIKALTYASNDYLQSNADNKITPESLMDNRGRIYSQSTIEKILNNIRVSKKSAYTIKNILERYIKDSSFNNKSINYLKDKIKEAKLDTNKENYFLSMLKDEDQFEDLLNISVNKPTENDLIKTLQDLNLKELYKKQKYNKINSSDNKKQKGVDILQDYLNDNQVTWDEFVNYLKDNFDKNKEIKEFLSNNSNIKNIRDDLVKILNSNIDVVFDEKPIEILNSKLEQAITSFINKNETTKDNSLTEPQKDALDTLINLGLKRKNIYNLIKDQSGTAEQIIEKILKGNK